MSCREFLKRHVGGIAIIDFSSRPLQHAHVLLQRNAQNLNDCNHRENLLSYEWQSINADEVKKTSIPVIPDPCFIF